MTVASNQNGRVWLHGTVLEETGYLQGKSSCIWDTFIYTLSCQKGPYRT